MNRLTIVYTDGYQEHYNVITPDNDINYLTGLKRYKDIIEDLKTQAILNGADAVIGVQISSSLEMAGELGKSNDKMLLVSGTGTAVKLVK